MNKLPEHNPKNGSGHKYNGKTYKQICLPGHPNACKRSDGVLYEHQYIAAKALGKALPRGVEVHHHGGGRRTGQLVLCEDKAYHRLLHTREKAYKATGDPNKRKCPFCQKWDDQENLRGNFNKYHPNGAFRHPQCQRNYNRIRRETR